MCKSVDIVLHMHYTLCDGALSPHPSTYTQVCVRYSQTLLHAEVSIHHRLLDEVEEVLHLHGDGGGGCRLLARAAADISVPHPGQGPARSSQ